MIAVIIQARTGSSRFPRKIFEDLNGKTTLYRVLEGATKNQLPHKIILAMPEYDKAEFDLQMAQGVYSGAIDNRFAAYFGDPDDLVSRYYGAASAHGVDLVVRLTADCPFGGVMVDEMLCEYLKKGYNGFMGSNELISPDPYPDGTDVEIFPYWMLVETMQLTKDLTHREHVTPFMYRRGTEYDLHPFMNHRPNTMISMKFNDFSFDTDEDRRLLLSLTKEYDKAKAEDPHLSDAQALNVAIKNTNFQVREWRGK